MGKSIECRTYQATAVYRKQLFVYGGSQLNKQVFGDLWKINLDQSLSSYKWVKLESSTLQ